MAKRGASRFRERELSRAVRAARAAGGVEKIRIAPDGSIDVILKDGAVKQIGGEDASEWEEEIAALKGKASKAKGR